MQNKFWTLITAFIDLIIATLGGFSLNWILNSQYALIEKWVFGILLCIGAFLLYAFNTMFLSKLYDSLRFVRKLFTPEAYIEGIWIQIIDDNKLRQMPPTKYSLISIKMENGRIVVEGHSYNQENSATQMTSFKIPYTTFINVDGTLQYHYEFITREYRTNPSYIGKAILKFEKKIGERCFSRYNGKIISNLPRGKNEILVRAFKNPKKIILDNGERVRINETTIKRQDVRNYIDNQIKEIF